MTDASDTPVSNGVNLTEEEPTEQAEPVAIATGTDESGDGNGVDIPDRLPVLPIRDSTSFPGTVMPLEINREKSKRVLDLALAGDRMVVIVAQRSPQTEDPHLDDLYRVGTAGIILKMLKTSNGAEHIIVHGLRRVGIESITEEGNYLEATVHAHEDPDDVTLEQKALAHTIRTAAERIIVLSPNIPDEARQVLAGLRRPGMLADFLAANLSIGLVQKQELLETFDVTERLRKVNAFVAAQLEVVELSHEIQEKVRDQVEDSQREYYLRQQMKAIQSELGDAGGAAETISKLRERIKDAGMPEQVKGEATREVDRLERISQASPEYGMALDHVEWLVEMPWSTSTKDRLDIDLAERILDEDHYGLDKVKKRILEFLAVRKLKKDSRGPILCLAGPPGVGKTSLGRSIARAMGRKFIRVSLGGIRDEATIRGHRRTYIGAIPGVIIREIRRAGSSNPLFMLDEVDKIGQDVRGDPMSALLEVLDPAQNSTFHDHYLGVPFDLSKVLFITTANYMMAIEPALCDRMEVIELGGYTRREKLMIAKSFLVPRQLDENGLVPEQIRFEDDTLAAIISGYTREAGVRWLERRIGAVCRARAATVARGRSIDAVIGVDDLHEVLGPREFESEKARKIAMPGVVTGLAFTSAGGEILFIEAQVMPGSGQLQLTGQLGDVMRESAVAASSIIRSRMRVGKRKAVDWYATDVHVHVPAGAIPKDGPSAGVAMLAAMTSALSGKAVDPTIGMTGEITLSGRVLAVGGIREKVLAAHRAGLACVLLPKRNEQDLEEIPEEIRRELEFVFLETIDDMLGVVFGEEPKQSRAPRGKKKASSRKTSSRKKRTSRKRTAARSARKGKKTQVSGRRKVSVTAKTGGRRAGAKKKRIAARRT